MQPWRGCFAWTNFDKAILFLVQRPWCEYFTGHNIVLSINGFNSVNLILSLANILVSCKHSLVLSAEFPKFMLYTLAIIQEKNEWKYKTCRFQDIANVIPTIGQNTKRYFLLCILFTSDTLIWSLQGHPKTRLLIYHGGSHGVMEAIYHGVPMVIIPLFGDQFAHAARVQKKGMGLMLDKSNLSEAGIMKAIREVIDNPR